VLLRALDVYGGQLRHRCVEQRSSVRARSTTARKPIERSRRRAREAFAATVFSPLM
jgi:hypothetical protein